MTERGSEESGGGLDGASESEVMHDVKNEVHGDKTFKWEVYNL